MSNTYPSYIPMNCKWVKQVPSHWSIKRLKAIFALRSERNDPIITSNILSLTAKQGVVPYAEKEGTGGNKPKEDLTKYSIARENDLLVNCMNVVSGAAGVSRYFGAISPVYYALYPRENENVWYYHHIFRLLSFQRSLIGLGKGILMHESDTGTLTTVRMRISMDYLGNVMLPVPPRDEQDQIVRFLDWKVSEINKLISAKKRQIKILEETEKRIINDTVLHGFHKSCFKDSSNKWIGNIPSEWNIIKLGKFCSFQNGISESGEFFASGTPFVGYGDVYRHLELPEAVRGVAQSNAEQQEVFSVREGDIFFTRTSENIEEIGMAAVCKHTIEKAIFSGFIIRCRPYKPIINIDYMKYYLQIPAIKNHFSSMMNIVTRASLGQNLLKQMPVVVPPMSEQKEIAIYLDTQHAKYSDLINAILKEIENLNEFKTRLISDTVTGKIDVRGIKIPEYEYVEEEADEENSVEDEDISEEADGNA